MKSQHVLIKSDFWESLFGHHNPTDLSNTAYRWKGEKRNHKLFRFSGEKWLSIEITLRCKMGSSNRQGAKQVRTVTDSKNKTYSMKIQWAPRWRLKIYSPCLHWVISVLMISPSEGSKYSTRRTWTSPDCPTLERNIWSRFATVWLNYDFWIAAGNCEAIWQEFYRNMQQNDDPRHTIQSKNGWCTEHFSSMW